MSLFRIAVPLALLAATILAGEHEHQLRLVQLRLELAEKVLKQAEETVQEHRAAFKSSRISEAELREALLAQDEAMAERDRHFIDLEEVRATGREPRHEIAAPLVEKDDFVKARLEISLRFAESRLSMAKRRAADAKRLSEAQAVSRGEILEAESEVEVVRAEHEALEALLRIRLAFVAGELPEAAAERQAAIAEVTSELRQSRSRSRMESRRLREVRTLFEVGRAAKADLREAQIEAARAKTEYEIARLELETLERVGAPRGVTELVFRVKTERDNREKVLDVIRERLARYGYEDVALGLDGEDRLSVRVPAASREKLDRIKALITTLGKLQFRITVEADASEHHAHYWKLFSEARRKGIHEKVASFIGPDDVHGDERARFPDGLRWYRVSDDSSCRRERWARGESGLPLPWVLCALDSFNIAGEDLRDVHAARETGGLGTGWAVYFKVKKAAQERLAKLTSFEEEEDKYMAIIVNGEVHAAPFLQSALSDSGQITGAYTEETAKMLAAILQAGSLETEPELVSERTIPAGEK
jgi:hypothetical protein